MLKLLKLRGRNQPPPPACTTNVHISEKGAPDVTYGDATCQNKARVLLQEAGLPDGLLPLKDITECGHVSETGYVWVKQKRRVDHRFGRIGRTVSYAPEITGYLEKGRIREVKGVCVREMMIWVTVSEICVEESSPMGKGQRLVCTTPAGLSRTFPASAFEEEGNK